MPKSCTLANLPQDLWALVTREWIGDIHDLARLDVAACHKELRQQYLDGIKGFLIDKVKVPRSKEAVKRLVAWLDARKVHIANFNDLEISHISNILEYFESDKNRSARVASICLKKTVSGVKDVTGMKLIPELLKLLPSLTSFQSQLGNYYSPAYPYNPHYLSFLPAEQLISLTEEIGRREDLERLQHLSLRALQFLHFTHAFINDGLLLHTLRTLPSLRTFSISKLDEFHELSFNDVGAVSSWTQQPSFTTLENLTLHHWNKRAHSVPEIERVLSAYMIHRAPRLRVVDLAGCYVTDLACLFLLQDKLNTLDSLSLQNTAETLDRSRSVITQLISSSHASGVKMKSLRTLILHDVCEEIGRSFLPLAWHPESISVHLTDVPNVSWSTLDQPNLSMDYSILRQVSLRNVPAAPKDIVHMLTSPLLEQFEWSRFPSDLLDDVMDQLEHSLVASEAAGKVSQPRLHTLCIASLNVATSDIADRLCRWITHPASPARHVRSLKLRAFPLTDHHLADILVALPHLQNLDLGFTRHLSRLNLLDTLTLVQKRRPAQVCHQHLRRLMLSNLSDLTARGLAAFVLAVPSLVRVAVDFCGEDIHVKDMTLMQLAGQVQQRPCKLFVHDSRVLPTKVLSN